MKPNLKPHKDATLGFFKGGDLSVNLVIGKKRSWFMFTKPVPLFDLKSHIVWNSPGGRTVTLHPPFVSDGTSVPKAFRWLLSKEGIHTRATILHDGGYDGRLDIKPHLSDEVEERAWLDYQLWNGMRALGVGPIKAYIFWAAVRAGGLAPWAKGSVRRRNRELRKESDKVWSLLSGTGIQILVKSIGGQDQFHAGT